MKKLVLLSFMSFYFLWAEYNISKGQAVILEFNKKGLKEIQVEKEGVLEKKKPQFFLHPSKDDKVILIFGSNYKKPLKKAQITALYANKEKFKYDILGNEGFYPSEILQVAADKINPPKEALVRIQKELVEARAVYANYTDEALFNGKFILPLDSVITSNFGAGRIFNGTLASYHSGTDFRAKIGTPIKASNDGKVVLAKDRYYAGMSVVIDHGYGIFSQYYHLSKLKVTLGQRVKKGQIIALSGDSGRVSGAHLHFGIFAGGIQVDPVDFIAKFNALFD